MILSHSSNVSTLFAVIGDGGGDYTMMMNDDDYIMMTMMIPIYVPYIYILNICSIGGITSVFFWENIPVTWTERHMTEGRHVEVGIKSDQQQEPKKPVVVQCTRNKNNATAWYPKYMLNIDWTTNGIV